MHIPPSFDVITGIRQTFDVDRILEYFELSDRCLDIV